MLKNYSENIDGFDEQQFLENLPRFLEHSAEITQLPENGEEIVLSAKPISRAEEAELLLQTSAMSSGAFSAETIKHMRDILEEMRRTYDLVLHENESAYAFCLRLNEVLHSGVHDLDSIHDSSARTMKEFLDNWESGKPTLGVCLAAASIYAYFCLKNDIAIRFSTYVLPNENIDNIHIRFFVQDSLGCWLPCEPQFRGLKLIFTDEQLEPVVEDATIKLVFSELMQNRMIQIHQEDNQPFLSHMDKLLMRLRTKLIGSRPALKNLKQQLMYHYRALFSYNKLFQKESNMDFLLMGMTHLEALKSLLCVDDIQGNAQKVKAEADLLINQVRDMAKKILQIIEDNNQKLIEMEEIRVLLGILTNIRDSKE